MLFKCPVCGRIKKYQKWIKVDRKVQKEAEDYDGGICIMFVKCPVCKIDKVTHDR